MNLLFIGGTGIISTGCTALALELGHAVTVLNRGHRAKPHPSAEHLCVDLNDSAALNATLAGRRWDAAVDFTVFTPEQLEQRIAAFRPHVDHYVFISSASAYQKPPQHYVVTEETPMENPFWQYSRDKIACEERLLRAVRDDAFPGTIVRPSLTFGDDQVTLAFNSWQRSYTVIDRLRRGLPVIIPSDGRTLWTITHNSDFAKGLIGLLGNAATYGEAFHITSDEVLTWNQYFQITAEVAGVSDPNFVHIPADFIAACLPDEAPGLIGDKLCSCVFDNTKIKRFVPDYEATTSYREGIARTLGWFDADPSRQLIDNEANAKWDRLIATWNSAKKTGVAQFLTTNGHQ